MLSRGIYTIRQWFKSVLSTPVRRRRRPVGQPSVTRSRPRLEQLETRLAPAVFTWTGASNASANWSDAANWSGGVAPNNNDGTNPQLIFPSGAARLINTDDMAAGTFASITISGPGYTFNPKSSSILLTLPNNGSITDSSGVAGTTINIPIALGTTSKLIGVTSREYFLVSAGGNLGIDGSLTNVSGTVNSISIGNSSYRGEVTLASNNATLVGSFSVNQGSILNAANSNALGLSTGSTATTTTIQTGAQLQLSGGISIANPLLLNGTGLHADGALLNEIGNNSYTGPITFNTGGPTYIGATSGTTLTINGIISDQGNPDNLTKEGLGTLVLDPQYSQTSSAYGNTYRGGTTINGGVLVMENSLALGQPASVGGTSSVLVNTGSAEAGELELNYVSQGSTFYDPNLIKNSSNTVVGFSVPTTYYLTLNGQGDPGDPYISDGSNTQGDPTGFVGSAHGALYNGAGNNSWQGSVSLWSSDTIAKAYYSLNYYEVPASSNPELEFVGFPIIHSPTVGINVAAGTQLTINGVINDSNLVTLPAYSGSTETVSPGAQETYELHTEGTGTLVLNGANSYTGRTVVTEGTLVLENSSALGATLDREGNPTAGAVIDSGATLALEAPASNDLIIPNNISTETSPYLSTALVGSSNDPVIENIDGSNQILGLITTGQWTVNLFRSTTSNCIFNIEGGSTVFDVLPDSGIGSGHNAYSQLTIGGFQVKNGIAEPEGGLQSYPSFNFNYLSGLVNYIGSNDNPTADEYYDVVKEGYGQLVLAVDSTYLDTNNLSQYFNPFVNDWITGTVDQYYFYPAPFEFPSGTPPYTTPYFPTMGFEGNIDVYQGWITVRTTDAMGGFISDVGQAKQPTVTVASYASVVAQVNSAPSVAGAQATGAAVMLQPYLNQNTLGVLNANLDPLDPQYLDYGANLSGVDQNFDLTGQGLSTSQDSDLPAQFVDMGALENVSGQNTITGNILFENAGISGAGPSIGVELLPYGAFKDTNLPNANDWDPNTTQLALQGLQYDKANDVLTKTNLYAGFTKVGGNELIIQGDGTYSGNVNISAGVLEIQNDTALGSGIGTTFVNAGTALLLAPTLASLNGGITRGVQVRGETLSLSETSDSVNFAQFMEGSVLYQYNPLSVLSYDNFWGGTVILATDITIDIRSYQDPTNPNQIDTARLTIQGVVKDTPNPTGSILTLSDSLSSPGDKTVIGQGTLVLASANTYRGGTMVDQGIITIANSQALGAPNAPVHIFSGGSIQTEGNLNIANPLTIAGSGTAAAPNVQATWFAQGPAAVNDGSSDSSNINLGGPITGIVADPQDPDVIYITTSGGGAWKTSDGGATWHPLLDLVPGMVTAFANGTVLSDNTTFTGAIAMDPNNPNIVYVGLGNSDNTADAFYGDGILFTTDGGNTWTVMTQPTGGASSNLFAGQTISQIIVDPATPKTTSTTAYAPDSTDPTKGIVIYVAVSGNAINGTAANGGIYEWGPLSVNLVTGADGPMGWTSLTANQVTVDKNSLGNYVFFSGSDDYTGLTVVVDPTAAYGLNSPHNRLISFAVGTPGDPLDQNGVYTVDSGNNYSILYDLAPEAVTPIAQGGFGADIWAVAGFPEGSATVLNFPADYNGQIKLATNSDMVNNPALTPLGTGTKSVQVAIDAAVAYADDAFVNGKFLSGYLQGLFVGTQTFSFATFTWSAPAWTNVGAPSTADTGLDPFAPVQQDWNRNMAIAATPPVWDGGTNAVYVAGWGDAVNGTNRGPYVFASNAWTDLSTAIPSNDWPWIGAHALAFRANGDLLIGTDGGIWELNGSATAAAGTGWTDLNGANFATGNLANSLQATEINGLGIDTNNSVAFAAGTQFDGTADGAGNLEANMTLGGWATNTAGNLIGTGATVQVNPQYPNIIYVSSGSELFESMDYGVTWTPLALESGTTSPYNDTPSTDPNPITNFPFVADPLDPARLVVATAAFANHLAGNIGTVQGWFPTVEEIINPGPNEQITVLPVLSTYPFGRGTQGTAYITAVGIAGYQGVYNYDSDFPDALDQGPFTLDTNTLYVADNLGGVWVTKDNGITWEERDNGLPSNFSSDPQSGGNGLYQVSSITVDPRDRDVAYVTYSSFISGESQIYMTVDAGQHWTPINVAISNGNSLPDLPIYSLVIDPRQGSAYNPTLYVGTDDGVYVRNYDPTQSPAVAQQPLADIPSLINFNWQTLGYGMPKVQVRSLTLNTTDNSLSAGTYGRGVFEIFLTEPVSNTHARAGAFEVLSGNTTWTGPINFDVSSGSVKISVNGSQSLQSTIGTTALVIPGTVTESGTVAGPTLDIISPLTLLTVADGRAYNDGGTLTLAGDNSLSGTILVESGVLDLQSPDALGSVNTVEVQADPNIDGGNGAALELQSDLQDTNIQLSGNGFEIAGHFTGSLLNYSGNNTYSGGSITLNSPTTIGVASGTQLTIGTGLSGDTTTITDDGHGYYLDKELSGILALTDQDAYSGNTYVLQGTLAVENSGALGSNSSSIVEVLDGAQLLLQSLNPMSAFLTLTQALYLSGTGLANDGALLNAAGNNVWSGPVYLTSLPGFAPASTPQSYVDIGVNTSTTPSSLKLSGVVQQPNGSPPVPPLPSDDQSAYTAELSNLASLLSPDYPYFGLNKVGAGELILTNSANSYGGVNTSNIPPVNVGTNVYGGILDLQANALGAADTITTVYNNATLQLDSTNGFTVNNHYLVLNGTGAPFTSGALYNATGNNTWAALSPTAGWQGITLAGSNSSNVAVGAAASTILTLNGASPVIQGVGSTTPNLHNAGAGEVVLGSQTNYQGTTFVDAGTLDDDGTLGAVTLNGGLLLGTGMVGAVTATLNGGAVGGGDGNTPGGNPAGVLTASSVTLNSASSLFADIVSNPATGKPTSPGKNNAELVVTGTLTVNSASTVIGLANTGTALGNNYIVSNSPNQPTTPVTPAYLNGIKFSVSVQPDATSGYDIVLSRQAATATLALSASSTTPQYGTDVTFTATVTPQGGTLTGDYVLFTLTNSSNQTLTQQYIQVNSDLAVFDPSKYLTSPGYPLVPGQYTVSAEFNPTGNSSYPADPGYSQNVTTSPVSVTVDPANTSTVVTSSDQNNAVYGENVTLTATVTDAAPNIAPSPAGQPATPQGTVTFFLGGTQLGTPQTLSFGGTATIALPAKNMGTYSIYAVYAPGTDATLYNGSTSAQIIQTINTAPTQITAGTATGSPDPQFYGQGVAFNVSISSTTPNSTTYPTGSVSFVLGTATSSTGTSLGSSTIGSNGAVTFSSTALPVGTDYIYAEFAGNSNYQANTPFQLTETVNPGVTQSSISEYDVTSGTSNAGSGFGDTVQFTATVTTPGATPVVVPGANTQGGWFTFTITQGSTTIATQTLQINSGTGQAVYSPSPSLLTIGSYTVSAEYNQNGDDPNWATSTASMTQVVGEASAKDTLTANPAGSSKYGQSVTFTATITPAGAATGTPTPTVTFTILQGSTTIGTPQQVTLQPNGTAQYTISTLPASSTAYTIQAAYSGNTSYAPNTVTIPYTVNEASTTTALTEKDLSNNTSSSGNSASSGYDDNIEFIATLTTTPVASPPLAAVSGSYTFTIKQGSTQIAQQVIAINSSTDQAIYTPSSTLLSPGTYTVTAVYGQDPDWGASTSNTLTQTVNAAATQVALSGNTGSAAPYGTVTILATVTSSAAPNPTAGSVTFTIQNYNGSATTTNTVSVNLSGSNTASLPTSNLPVGTNTVTAVYNANGNYAQSPSAQVTQVVQSDPTTTTLSSNPSNGNGNYGSEPTLTATVNCSVAPAPTVGSVTFTILNTSTNTSTTQQVTLSGSDVASLPLNLAPGSYSVTAAYSGNGSYGASPQSSPVSVTISADQTSTLLQTTLSSGAYGQPVISATVSNTTVPATTPTGSVTFTILNTATNSSSTQQINLSGNVAYLPSLNVGSYKVTAMYNPSNGDFGTSTSATVPQTITALGTTTTVATSDANPAVGEVVTFTVTVAPTQSAVSPNTIAPPSGTVTFFANGTQIGNPVTVTGNTSTLQATASTTDTFTNSGHYTITATFTPTSGGNYAGSNNSSQSPAVVENVTQGTLVITSGVPSIVSGQTVVDSGTTFNMTVTYKNSSGNAVPGYSGPVTLNFTGPASGLVVGSTTVSQSTGLTVNCVNGVATFSGVYFDKLAQSGSGYNLSFTDSAAANSPVSTGTVLVVPPTVNTTVTNTSGQAVTSVKVNQQFNITIASITDKFGNVGTFGGTNSVSLSLVSGPAGGLQGTLSGSPAAGTKAYTFSGLSLSKIGTYVIQVQVEVATGVYITTDVTISAYSLVIG